GGTWSPGGIPTGNHLYGVDQLGARVWAVGANGTCWQSTNGGSNWNAVNLKIDSRSDVRAVTLQGADSVFISGGGGFIRLSSNNGGNWTFPIHGLMGEVGDMHFVGMRGWVVSPRSPSLMRTADRGATWSFASGTTIARSWAIKQAIQSGSNRGSAIALHPVHRNTIYSAIGSRFYVSRNDGETWTQFSTLPSGYTKVNAFLVSPKDSMVMVCTASPPQVLLYSDDGGMNWAVKRTDAFGEYGIPLEMHPDKPDTIIFGPDNDVLYRSTDFGKTWGPFGSKVFRSPCDIVVVPESDSAAVLVGDGITGSGVGDLWRSTNGGVNFSKHYTTSGSEIPGMSISRLDNTRAFATNWNSGGVERTTNTGLQWTQIQTTVSAWGTDICREDPNVVLFGVYSGAQGYLSLDGGDSFTSSSLAGSNYSFYARDRGCILAEQGGGIYKLASTYTFNGNANQTINVTAANGGEVWAAGSVHDITWTATDIVMARVEYRVAPESTWVLVAELPGYYGRTSWTLPFAATSSARVRVRDAFDGAPSDESSADFTIALANVAHGPDSLDFGQRPKGSASLDSVTVTNSGTATLNVTAIGTGTSRFQASPSALTLAPAASAKVYVTFLPDAAQLYADQLTITSNAWNSPSFQIPLSGEGLDTLQLDLLSPAGGENFKYGTTQKVAWSAALVPTVDIDYRIGAFSPWLPIAAGVPAGPGTFDWLIPDAPTATGQLRVRESGGGAEDLNASAFSIVVPRFRSNPFDIKDIGPVIMGGERTDTLRIVNWGSATLTISSVTLDRPTFRLGRSSMVVLPGGSDTLGVTYTPASLDRDTATVSFIADDPAAPHQILVTGFGTLVTGVDDPVIAAFALWQNQPNPFRGVTRIGYSLPRAANVELEVFNLQGQRVVSLVNESQGPGIYHQNFAARRTDGSLLPTGVYFYRFRAGAFSATRKMLLMR
ncbi:MAG: choice-of-anchor D domain-containing protein, partial [Candidatus Eisenbacteria bacterium]